MLAKWISALVPALVLLAAWHECAAQGELPRLPTDGSPNGFSGRHRACDHKKTASDRIACLIQQLGADAFERQQAAGKALEAIGQPAWGALRKAAASSGDLEIRRRAEQVLKRALDREAGKLAGTWQLLSSREVAREVNLREPEKEHTLTFTGYRWEWRQNKELIFDGMYQLSIVPGGLTGIDLIVPEGACKGTALAIFRIEGDMLYYAKSETNHPRPTSFAVSSDSGWSYSHVYQRVRP